MMKLEDYKTVKNMDERTLGNYLLDIYFEGYRAGVQVMVDGMGLQPPAADAGDQPA